MLNDGREDEIVAYVLPLKCPACTCQQLLPAWQEPTGEMWVCFCCAAFIEGYASVIRQYSPECIDYTLGHKCN
jgi:hypothetical protein